MFVLCAFEITDAHQRYAHAGCTAQTWGTGVRSDSLSLLSPELSPAGRWLSKGGAWLKVRFSPAGRWGKGADALLQVRADFPEEVALGWVLVG